MNRLKCLLQEYEASWRFQDRNSFNHTHKTRSYLTENTTRRHYRDKPCQSQETDEQTMWVTSHANGFTTNGAKIDRWALYALTISYNRHDKICDNLLMRIKKVDVLVVTPLNDVGSLCRFFFLWRCGPTRAMAFSFMRFLDNTQRRITVGRTPLDEWSARRRDLYLTTHNTHNRHTPTPPVGFEPTISAGERPLGPACRYY